MEVMKSFLQFLGLGRSGVRKRKIEDDEEWQDPLSTNTIPPSKKRARMDKNINDTDPDVNEPIGRGVHELVPDGSFKPGLVEDKIINDTDPDVNEPNEHCVHELEPDGSLELLDTIALNSGEIMSEHELKTNVDVTNDRKTGEMIETNIHEDYITIRSKPGLDESKIKNENDVFDETKEPEKIILIDDTINEDENVREKIRIKLDRINFKLRSEKDGLDTVKELGEIIDTGHNKEKIKVVLSNLPTDKENNHDRKVFLTPRSTTPEYFSPSGDTSSQNIRFRTETAWHRGDGFVDGAQDEKELRVNVIGGRNFSSRKIIQERGDNADRDIRVKYREHNLKGYGYRGVENPDWVSGGQRKYESQGHLIRTPCVYSPISVKLATECSPSNRGLLRPIVIDGSNVAFYHGRNKVFSVKGIDLVVKYFEGRGHRKIVAFVPQFRALKRKSSNQCLMKRLEKAGLLVFTPRLSHDDAFMLDYATKHGGVVVSRDQFRDLANKKEWKEVVANRLLVPTFVGNDLMFPQDPLGRNGPDLDRFLKF